MKTGTTRGGALPEISIVVPILNEVDNIEEFCKRTVDALPEERLEILFVDGGSSDGSAEKVRKVHEGDSRVKLVRLSRAFGRQLDLMAGLHFASGRAIITMDGDLQHPPELIPKLLKEWRNGSAAVFTTAHYGKNAPVFRRLTSRLFHRLWAYLAHIRVQPGLSGFMLLDRRAVNALLSMKERARFPIGLVQWLGYSNTTVEFDVAPRHSGRTKFSPRGLLALAAEGISSFSAFPLHIALYVGTAFALLGFVYAGYAVVVATVLRHPVPGWASILCAVTIIGGVQLISLGVIGVYVGHIFDEVKGRPLCVVDSIVGVNQVDAPGEAPGPARSWVLVDKSET